MSTIQKLLIGIHKMVNLKNIISVNSGVRKTLLTKLPIHTVFIFNSQYYLIVR